MRVALGRDMKVAVCRAIGLDPSLVRRLTIECACDDDAPLVSVKLYVTHEQLAGVAAALASDRVRVTLAPRPEGK